MNFRFAQNENGFVMVMALLLLLVLTLLGIASIGTTNFETLISGNERLGHTAFYAAEAGVQVGLNQMPDTGPVAKAAIGTDAEYACTVEHLGLARNLDYDQSWSFSRYRVDSTGVSAGAAREVEVQASFGPFQCGTGYNND
jgi:Tfp pilus assembly protein PilX